MEQSAPTQKRRSLRLQHYDYGSEGLYFVTICCRNKAHLFGKIINGDMMLNGIGEIARQEWCNTPRIRQNIRLHDFVVMPNHVHAVIEITENLGRGVWHTPSPHTTLRSPSHTLGAVVRGYKSAVSKQAGFPVWQRNYHEHIIRSETSYAAIAEYVRTNPQRWLEDCFYS